MTTHHFVCMMSKTTLFATLKKCRQQLEDHPIMTTPTPHHFHGGGWTMYIQANGWLSCEDRGGLITQKLLLAS